MMQSDKVMCDAFMGECHHERPRYQRSHNITTEVHDVAIRRVTLYCVLQLRLGYHSLRTQAVVWTKNCPSSKLSCIPNNHCHQADGQAKEAVQKWVRLHPAALLPACYFTLVIAFLHLLSSPTFQCSSDGECSCVILIYYAKCLLVSALSKAESICTHLWYCARIALKQHERWDIFNCSRTQHQRHLYKVRQHQGGLRSADADVFKTGSDL